jgi:hypothetical protein
MKLIALINDIVGQTSSNNYNSLVQKIFIFMCPKFRKFEVRINYVRWIDLSMYGIFLSIVI